MLKTNCNLILVIYYLPLMGYLFSDYYSWRHPETGTWFIQCLCQVLEEEGQKSSLQDILTEVSRRVATDYESYNDLYVCQHEQKQVPQINSTLLRQVYFWPKD